MPDFTTIHPTSESRKHLVDLFVWKSAPVNLDESNPVEILVNDGYVVGYCPTRFQPLWSAYRVAGFSQDIDYDRPHLYYEDTRLSPESRLGPETFGTVGGVQYHVGHLAPNEVINRQFGRLAQMETFFMSNMSPQRGSLNTGVWLKLETKIRNIEDTRDKDHVWALSGPVFESNPQFIERSGGKMVPIPSSYYCILIDPFRYPWDRVSNVDVAYFLIPQDAPRSTPLEEFLTDRHTIQEATKLNFFPAWEPAPERAGAAVLAPAEEPVLFGTSETRHRLLKQL